MSSVGLAAGIGSAGLYAVVTNPAQAGAKPEDAEEKSHHLKGGKGFRNPWPSFKDASVLSLLSSMAGRKLRGESNTPDTTPPTVPVQKPTFLPTRETPKLRATWLGHACYYVEFPSGLRVLFDPVFEDCCAPVNLSSFKRYTEPPCEIEDLPFVDAVVISHNHYDHLSYPTTQRIHKKFPNAHFFAPRGNKKWFEASGVTNVTELDWWDTRDVKLEDAATKAENPASGSVSQVSVSQNSGSTNPQAMAATISCLPCQHLSARSPFDKCKTLWASWSIASGGSNVYFAGDTGYRSVPHLPPTEDDYSPAHAHLPVCPAFREIGTHKGPFDLGLIPIGAYAPRFIMSPMHANPRDAVRIFKDTRCVHALGMHWGTWVLTEEDVLEPPRLLAEALAVEGVERQAFGVLDIGESWEGGGE